METAIVTESISWVKRHVLLTIVMIVGLALLLFAFSQKNQAQSDIDGLTAEINKSTEQIRTTTINLYDKSDLSPEIIQYKINDAIDIYYKSPEYNLKELRITTLFREMNKPSLLLLLSLIIIWVPLSVSFTHLVIYTLTEINFTKQFILGTDGKLSSWERTEIMQTIRDWFKYVYLSGVAALLLWYFLSR